MHGTTIYSFMINYEFPSKVDTFGKVAIRDEQKEWMKKCNLFSTIRYGTLPYFPHKRRVSLFNWSKK